MTTEIKLYAGCTGCEMCAIIASDIFQIINGQVAFQDKIDPSSLENIGDAQLAAEECPNGVIEILE